MKIMRKKVLGIFVCMLLIITVLPVSGTLNQKSLLSNEKAIGTKGDFKSKKKISSPDGNNYTCIMFCENHQQTLGWISLINTSGFEKAWRENFIKLTAFFLLPGTIILYGLDDFRVWYLELFIKLKYKNEFLNFLDTYDTVNGSGMITYLWLTGKTNRPIDFKAQPDNSWVEDSWVLDNGVFIPNSEIWGPLLFWYFDLKIPSILK
jgi:hypothetical protein